MKLRTVILGFIFIILPPEVLGESRHDFFLQCHPSLTHAVAESVQSETISNICQQIPSIHWERCANYTLNKLSNNDSNWRNKPSRVTITKDQRPNAFLMNQHQIILTSGLTNLISSGEQLAFVIAHELAHALIDECSSRDSGQEMNGYCEYLRSSASLSRQYCGNYVPSNEVEADRIGLMIMRAHNFFITHPTSLLEAIANDRPVSNSTVPTEIGMRIASLKQIRSVLTISSHSEQLQQMR